MDHNPARSLFPKGAAPKDLRFPSCSECNREKKDAESRAALVASVFSRIDPPNSEELQRSVDRGLGFFDRDTDFRATITEHPSHMWDFARGTSPSERSDPMSALDIPHTLPSSFGSALLVLGRFFGQALYYKLTKRVLTPLQMVGACLITNAAPEDDREIARGLGENLRWFVPEPADQNQLPLFGFGAAYVEETSTLYFAGERRGAFVWFGVAGEVPESILRMEESHIWYGDGASVRP